MNSRGLVQPVGTGRTTVAFSHGGQLGIIPVKVTAGKQSLPIDFKNDIVPIFTRYGCNGGGCHGKTTGRGGFRLSLFGFIPKLDYETITREERGRRVFPASPMNSLLLQKPLMRVPHGGGRRLTDDQPETALLKRWISERMPWSSSNSKRLERLEIFPASRIMRFHQTQSLVATAVYSDGSRRDVTRLVRFRAHDPSLVRVDSENASITAGKRIGETAIVGLYQGESALCRISIPVTDPDAPTPKLQVRNFVDRHVLKKLRELRMPASHSAQDGVFLRRATVQIAGRLPTLQETKTFLAESNPQKYDRLIDRLVNSEGFADVFAQKWSALLRNKRRGQEKRIPGTRAFHQWIRDAFHKNMPFDQFARRILTATESVKENPPAQWYAEVRYLDRYVDDTAQVFLGLRMGCARCHHHPFEKFSQEDYFGLAAFFSRVGRTGGTGGSERASNETIYVQSSGEVKHPVTGETVRPRGLFASPQEIPPCEDPRDRLVDWMTAPDNPFFAKAFVNRLWAHFFGRGLVNPIDDMRETNPPSNVELLNALAREFIERKFDVKHLVRVICKSQVYRLSSTPNSYNLDDTLTHSRFLPQRLTAETLLDAIDTVTKIPTNYENLPAGTRAIQLPDEGDSNRFLKMFGRPERASACECERESTPSLRQSMFLLQDPFILNKIEAEQGLAAQLAKDARSLDARIDELFLRTLSRYPTHKERQQAKKYIAREANVKTAFADLLWALIHTKEFLFVH
ncbi:MAG: DUF1549 domain-containing protein [Planctomycetaceae bacterium]